MVAFDEPEEYHAPQKMSDIRHLFEGGFGRFEGSGLCPLRSQNVASGTRSQSGVSRDREAEWKKTAIARLLLV